MAAVEAVEIAVIFVAETNGGYGGRDPLSDPFVGKCQLLLQNVLLGGDLHFLLKQMAEGGF